MAWVRLMVSASATIDSLVCVAGARNDRVVLWAGDSGVIVAAGNGEGYHRSSGISRNESAQDADEAGEHRLDDAGDHRRDEAGNHCPASWITLRPALQT